jgi:D-amino-acid dehydrogenase
MRVLILGAGIIGVSTAWHLLERGHEVVVADRQPDAALETSFANAAQISVSYCEPWANRDAPLKALKWMFRNDAPLLFRPRLDPYQWRWALQFLGQCNDAAFDRNVQQLVALGAYSHAALKDIVRATGIRFSRLERGIAHFYTDQKAFDTAGDAAALMQKYGVARRVVSRDELLQIEPAFKPFGHRIVGGTYTESDESGDARVFTQALARRCAERGAEFLFGHAVQRLESSGGTLASVTLQPIGASPVQLQADAVVVACGSFTAPLLRQVGVDLPIYPGKGYSATFKLLKPQEAPFVSTIDDEVKCAMSRLEGDTPDHPGYLRVAGTIEVGGYDASLNSPVARARCQMLADRVSEVLPGVCDTRNEAEGGRPSFWAGLRPATPTNIPFIGQTPVGKLWVNAGHGTLGWTHGAGSGKALAELISGEQPLMAFRFYGGPFTRRHAQPVAV